MPVLGMRETTNLATDQRAKAWRLGIMDQYPDAAPLSHLIYRVGKETVSDPEFYWWERQFNARELTVGAGDTPDSQTAGVADTCAVGTDEAYNCKLGTILLNTTTFERVMVSSNPTSGTSINITRGIGSSGAQTTMAAGQKLQVIGNAQAEGAGVGQAITNNPTKYYNYCQIFRNVADLSNTLLMTTLRTGDPWKNAQKEALLQHELDKEWAWLFGIKSEDTSATPGGRRTTDGLYARVTTNVTSFSSGLTLSGWNDALADPMLEGSDEKLLLCGSDMILALEAMARHNTVQWSEVPMQDSFGMNLVKWRTPFGTVFIKEHKLLSKNSALKDWGFLIDPDQLVYRYVKGRDTEWLPNRQDAGDDRKIGEYLAECGTEIHQEYMHAIFKDCSSYVGG